MSYLKDEEKKLLPTNVYKTYIEYVDEATAVRKLALLLDTFKQTVHFFGCVFLSEYLYDETISDKVKSKVNKMIPSLARPSLGSWYAFMRDYYRGRKDDEVFIKCFNDCMKELMSLKGLETYKGRFRKDMEQMKVFDELISLRNSIAHGAVGPNETEANEIVTIYSTYLDSILRGFIPVFSKYKVVKLTELADNYDTYTAYFDIINYDEKHDEHYAVDYDSDEKEKYIGDIDEAVGKLYLLCEDNRLLKLAEYLLEIPDDEEHEDYYLFDGLGNKDVVYLGMRYRKFIAKYLEDIQRKFRERGASTKWTTSAFDLEAFKNTLDNLVDSVIDIHVDSKKYHPDVYVERECDYCFGEFLNSDKTTMVVTAEAGVGKTNFLCHASAVCKKLGYYTYMLSGNTLVKTDSDSVLYDRMKAEFLDENTFPNIGEFLAFFDKKISGDEKFVLLLDAVNESYHVESVLNEVDRITNYGERYSWLKIVVSMRTVSFDIFRNRILDACGKRLPLFTIKDRYYSIKNDGKEQYWITISEWNILQTIDAFERYSEKYSLLEKHLSFHQLNRELQELLMNPLNLGLFFEAISSEFGASVEIRSEYDLFNLLEKSWGVNDAVTDCVKKAQDLIISEMIEQKTNELDADLIREIDEKAKNRDADDIRLFLLSPYERLKDLGILYEKNYDQITIVAFVYQRYLEYQLMKKFAKMGCSIEEIVQKMLDAVKYIKLPEEEIAWLQLLKKIDDIPRALDVLLGKASANGGNLSDVEVAAEEMIRLAAINGRSSEIVDILMKYGVSSWGINAANKLAIAEESDAMESLLKQLLERKETLNITELQEVYFQYGKLCMNVSRHDESEELLNNSIEIIENETADAARIQLAKNLRQSGKVDKAKEILKAFLSCAGEDKPYYADALIQRGLCKRSEKDYEGALADYLKAEEISIRQNEYYVTIYNQLGISTVYKDLGNNEKAEEVLYEVFRESSKRGYTSLLSDSLNGLSDLALRKGDYEKAISYAQQGLIIWEHSKFFRGQMVMFCHLIKAYRSMGGHDKEIQYYKNRAKDILDQIKERVILEMYMEAIEE